MDTNSTKPVPFYMKIKAFVWKHIGYIFFFTGLVFFGSSLALMIEGYKSGRPTEVRRSGLALSIIGSTGLLFGSIIIFIYGADREVVEPTMSDYLPAQSKSGTGGPLTSQGPPKTLRSMSVKNRAGPPVSLSTKIQYTSPSSIEEDPDGIEQHFNYGSSVVCPSLDGEDTAQLSGSQISVTMV